MGLRVALEFDGVAEPISGRILGDDGFSRDFVGWLELTRALEDARHGPPSGGPSSVEREPSSDL
jgi:hypothetical protein